MKKVQGIIGILLFVLSGFFNIGHAALNDLGNGLVNDDTLNITWMKDANLFKTLCDANDSIVTGFTPVDKANAAAVCADNGEMSWNDAEAWMARLNAQSYLGYNNWRQPSTTQTDASCSSRFAAANLPFYPEQRGGFNCTASELGNLFNITLGNPNDGDGSNCFNPPATAPNHCFQTTLLFDNAQSFAFWSGSSYAPSPAHAWFFSTFIGSQRVDLKVNAVRNNITKFVWPVRSGQSVVVPVTTHQVPTLSIWGLGIMSLLLAFVARRKAR